MDERMLSIDEVAYQLKVSPSTVRRWLSSGRLTGHKAGGQWRFDPVTVREALKQGMLSQKGKPQFGPEQIAYHEPPEWAKSVLSRWRVFVEDQIRLINPDHIIVNDRRGAKIWRLIMPNHFTWGKNLWHSTAVDLMASAELRQLFGRRRILLFDEMMQHGREMYELRQRLIGRDVNASVHSLVCVRRKSHVESGELMEHSALACEDLGDIEFADRAAFISRLAHVFEPPLDIDHLVVKGSFVSELSIENLLARFSQWGIPFVVWPSDRDHEFMAVTLDRPQFFDTADLSWGSGLSFGWEGPAKLRFYANPGTKLCYCSLIVYPDVEASLTDWGRIETLLPGKKERTGDPGLLKPVLNESTVRRAYSIVSTLLAVKLLNDFILSGAAEQMGIRFDDPIDAVDSGELQATFGPSIGDEISKQVREVLSRYGKASRLFDRTVQCPLPLTVREDAKISDHSYDVFKCRGDLLRTIPQRNHSASPDPAIVQALSWKELVHQLSTYSETTVGRVFDYELDAGTVKPLVLVAASADKIRLWRGYCRGEFGVWFEWDKYVITHKDMAIQRTFGLGPTVVEHFLTRMGTQQITATHFDKVFSNLQHDLRDGVHDMFYLGWRPYKLGPVPVVPVLSASGEFMEFQRFLVDQKFLIEKEVERDGQTWRRYEAPDSSEMPWRELFKTKTGAVTRAHIMALVRFYAALHKKCITLGSSSVKPSVKGVLQRPLVALASARNERIAYICCWFEFTDWKAKGELLFSTLGAFAVSRSRPKTPFLRQHAESFAAPARFLADKIQMYRDLPYLREQIVDLVGEGDFEVGEIVLETVDLTPEFRSHTPYPMNNMEWACNTMRAFSSMTRQVLTVCGLDIDKRVEGKKTDKAGFLKDAQFYLEELAASCSEIQSMVKHLKDCIIASREGIVTPDMADCLSKTFYLLHSVLESQHRIPDPRPQNERDRERGTACDGLVTRCLEVNLPDPYAIAVTDIKNLYNLPKLGEVIGMPTDLATVNLLRWAEHVTRDVLKRHPRVIQAGWSGDNVIVAGASCDDVFLATIDLIRETSRQLAAMDRDIIAPFGLFRAGIAWSEHGLGSAYRGARPGMLAYKLADKPGRKLGAIVATQAVMNRLSPKYSEGFVESDLDDKNDQGKTFIRHWDHGRDKTWD